MIIIHYSVKKKKKERLYLIFNVFFLILIKILNSHVVTL